MGYLILVNPGGREEIYQELGGELMAVEPPLWCRLIAGYCRDKGHTVEIIDAEAENISSVEVGKRIALAKPDLVGMIVYGHQPNASTQQMAPASETCLAIKGFSNTPIVIAGGHVTVLPERTLEDEHVDFVAMGEGAITIEKLLSGESHYEIPGLVFWSYSWNSAPNKSDRHIFKNQSTSLLDVKELHGDVWDLLPMEKYRAHNWHCDGNRQPYASIYTSLGCPFKCSFCCINAPFGGPGYRTRSPEKVVEEVRHLFWNYGIRNFKIIDEMFVLKPSHYIPICEGLAKLPFADQLNFWAYARIDTVKPENLKLLRAAGIRWLALGIESGSAYVRDGAEKSIDQQDIYDIVKAIQDADIKVIGNFIFGLPDDTNESMRNTLNLAMDLNCDFVNFYSAMAYPGSKLFTQADQKDLPETWVGYSQHSYKCKPLPTQYLTATEVLKFRDMAHEIYFKNSPILSKPLRRKLLE